jgi:AbiV family abortive infection protein
MTDTEANLQETLELFESMGKPVPFRGRLSPKQIADGMNAVARNATRLVNDAEVLLEAKRYPSAAALAVLAIEEGGKLPILRGLSTAKDDEAVKTGWKDYRSHQSKNVMWLLPMFALAGVKTFAEFGRLFDPNSKHRQRLDELKQHGFYSDCFEGGAWSEPEHFIDEVIARFVVRTAKSLTKKYPFSEREIELWVDHVGGDQSVGGVKKFWEAMTREGLAYGDVDVDEMLALKPETE